MRTDGRTCDEYRQISIEFDPITNSYGSCLVKMVSNKARALRGFEASIDGWFLCSRKGETKIIVTIKAEICTPDPNKPDCGKIEFFVDW